MKYLIFIFYVLLSCENKEAINLDYVANDLLAIKKNEGFFLINFESTYQKKINQRLLSMSPNSKFLVYATMESYSDGFDFIYLFDVQANKIYAKLPFFGRSELRNIKWNKSSSRMSFQATKVNKEGVEEDVIEMIDLEKLKIHLIYRNLDLDNELEPLNWLNEDDHVLILKNKKSVFYFDTKELKFIQEKPLKEFFLSDELIEMMDMMFELNIVFSDSLNSFYFISESNKRIKKADFYEKSTTALYRFNSKNFELEKLSPDSIHVTDLYYFDRDDIIFTGFTAADIRQVAEGESSLSMTINNKVNYYKIDANIYHFSLTTDKVELLHHDARFLHHY